METLLIRRRISATIHLLWSNLSRWKVSVWIPTAELINFSSFQLKYCNVLRIIFHEYIMCHYRLHYRSYRSVVCPRTFLYLRSSNCSIDVIWTFFMDYRSEFPLHLNSSWDQMYCMVRRHPSFVAVWWSSYCRLTWQRDQSQWVTGTSRYRICFWQCVKCCVTSKLPELKTEGRSYFQRFHMDVLTQCSNVHMQNFCYR